MLFGGHLEGDGFEHSLMQEKANEALTSLMSCKRNPSGTW